jgi:hypothetical protein
MSERRTYLEPMATLAQEVVVPVSAKRGGPVAVALAVLVLYAAGLGVLLTRDHDPAQRAEIGANFLAAGHGHSRSIDALQRFVSTPVGYDGQFALYIALSPAHAPAYIDDPAYRYERILYPALARTLALGQPALVPWLLLLVNLAAAVLLTFWTATYLQRRETSPWYALIVGSSPALAAAASRDLVEPLAYALVAGGVLAVFTARRAPVVLAGVAFGLAGLTRETTTLYAVGIAACLAAGVGERGRERVRRPEDAALLLMLGCGPILTLKLMLSVLVSGSSVPASVRPELVPFAGLIARRPFGSAEVAQTAAVVVPSCLALLLVVVLVRRLFMGAVLLALNWLVLVVMLPTKSYEHVLTSSRIALGVPLAFVLCLPRVRTRARLLVALVPTVYWMLAWL